MRFGESLAKLAGEIGEEYTARKSAAGVRAAAVVDLRTAAHDALALSAAQRAAMAKTQGVDAKALREGLDASRRKASAEVEAFREKVRQDRSAVRKAVSETLAGSIARLRVDVAAVRKDVQDQFVIARSTWGASPGK